MVALATFEHIRKVPPLIEWNDFCPAPSSLEHGPGHFELPSEHFKPDLNVFCPDIFQGVQNKNDKSIPYLARPVL